MFVFERFQLICMEQMVKILSSAFQLWKKRKIASYSVVESSGTVLSTGNFGNKSNISTMIMISECNGSNGSVISRTFL